MNWDWTVVLQILNTAILVILGLFLRSYLPSYFRKKGENQATKEDTRDISGLDEGVRSAIQEIKSTRDEYLREQRNYLLKFYDLAVEFYYEKLAVSFGDIIVEDGKPLVIFQESFHKNVIELLKSYQRIVVYFDDKAKVRITSEKFLLQAIKARKVMKKYFGRIKTTLIHEMNPSTMADKVEYRKAVEDSNHEEDKYWKEMKPIMDEAFDDLRQYLTALNEFLRPEEIPNVPKGMFSRDA
ncbi:MAG: hypothetical protein DCC56_11225 [Anaerolineae bacterium]|nr:MAG: hypothetical protein DCC56_11225 [Anaerolineae bacterium]WKZ45755.1 MAG: hypothetical protein QY302_08170 [Anaerolineales bacterium]